MLMPRQYVRHPVDLEVRCSLREASLVSRARNLSRGGLFLTSEVTLPVAESVEITLTLPERSDELHARGQVIWNSGPEPAHDARPGPRGMGLKFVEMSPADSAALAEYLAMLSGRGSRFGGTN